MENKPQIIGKILLKATITNTSPLLIATGKGDTTDFEVIKDKNGKPFIPAAGFAGMLRASFEAHKSRFDTGHLKYFWGTDADETKKIENVTKKGQIYQSHIIIDDLRLQGEHALAVRDGVAIEHKTNTAQKGSKYDYELIEKGAKFSLQMEITIRDGFDKGIFLQFLHYIIENGKQGHYQQGAFKTNGFGILEWAKKEDKNEDVNVYVFDFPKDGKAWLAYCKNNETSAAKAYSFSEADKKLGSINKNALIIKGTFSIKNALIIGSAKGGIESGLDKTHLKDSAEDAIFTAKSARGPIRHRALRILNTINEDTKANKEIINKLFGFVDEKAKKAQKGRFKTFEVEITGANSTQIQPRIKIDRFTGGTIEGALMQTQPLWHEKERFELTFEIENCTAADAGLMLLVMKDLMTEDLPMGGEKAIGRGLLNGSSLSIKGKVKGETEYIKIYFDATGITDKADKTNIDLVNKWVKSIKA